MATRAPIILAALFCVTLCLQGGAAGPGKADIHGDALPAHADTRIGTIRWRNAAPLILAAFLADGKSVLTASSDGCIKVWEYPSGKLLRQNNFDLSMRGGTASSALAMTSDGKYLAVAGPTSTDIIDVSSGRSVARLGVGSAKNVNQVVSFAFSPDGKYLAEANYDGLVHLIEWANGKIVRTLGTPNLNGQAFFNAGLLAFSPNGTRLALGFVEQANQQVIAKVKLFDTATGNEIRSIELPNLDPRSLGFSPDGKKLACSDYDDKLMIIDLDANKQILLERGENRFSPGSSFVFSPQSGNLFVWRRDGDLTEWDPATGHVRREFTSVTPRQSILSLENYGEECIGLSPDAKTLVVSGPGFAPRFFDLQGGKELAIVSGQADPVLGVAFSEDGKRLVTRHNDGTAQSWHVSTGKPEKIARAPNNNMRYTALDPLGQTAFTATRTKKSSTFALVDLATGKTLNSIEKPKLFATAIVFSTRGDRAVFRSSAEPKLEVYDLPSCKLVRSIGVSVGAADPRVAGGPPMPGGSKRASPTSMSLSSDGNLLAAYSDATTLSVWDLTTGNRILQLPTGRISAARPNAIPNGGNAFGFSDDGRCLAYDLGDGRVKIFELATGGVRREIGEPIKQTKGKKSTSMVLQMNGPSSSFSPQGMSRVAFSPSDWHLIAAGEADKIDVYDIVSGARLVQFATQSGPVRDLALSSDGKLLASANSDSTALIWNLSNLQAGPVPGPDVPGAEDWAALASIDCPKAFDAICRMVGRPDESCKLIRKNFKSEAPLDIGVVARLIRDLDHDQYKVRQKASADLARLGRRTLPAIDRALAGSPSMEAHQRLEDLRVKLNTTVLQGEELRSYRAIEVLERIGNEEARGLLREMASGQEGAVAPQAAQKAIERLDRRR